MPEETGTRCRDGPAPAGGSRSSYWCKEFRLLLALAGPSALTTSLRTAQLLTDQSVIGHLNLHGHSTPLFLDAASLALLWMNLTIAIMVRGFGGTINLLTSQALGSGNKPLADAWLLTGVLLSIAGAAIVCGLWLLTAQVTSLYAANQTLGSPSDGNELTSGLPWRAMPDGRLAAGAADAHLSDLLPWNGTQHEEHVGSGALDPVALAGEYARLSIGYILPTLWMEALSNWLLAHRVIKPQLLVYVLAFLLNLGLNLVLVHGVDGFGGLGFRGSPLATTSTRVLQLIGLVAVVRPLSKLTLPRTRLEEAIRPSRLRTFGAQCLPRMLSAALEELALQTVGALAGKLGAVETATHNAMLVTFFWLTAPLYGVGAATQQRMGFHLGAGRWREARDSAKLCLVVQMSLGLIGKPSLSTPTRPHAAAPAAVVARRCRRPVLALAQTARHTSRPALCLARPRPAFACVLAPAPTRVVRVLLLVLVLGPPSFLVDRVPLFEQSPPSSSRAGMCSALSSAPLSQ